MELALYSTGGFDPLLTFTPDFRLAKSMENQWKINGKSMGNQ